MRADFFMRRDSEAVGPDFSRSADIWERDAFLSSAILEHASCEIIEKVQP